MNDWSYACTAKLLATAILDGAKPPPRPPRVRLPGAIVQIAATVRCDASHLIQRGQQILAQIRPGARARMTAAPSRR